MRLRWAARALDDLERIELFNEPRSEEWARRVQQRIGERCLTLLQFPAQGRPIEGARRQLTIQDIQYVVTYRPGPDDVLILRVRSTRQDQIR